MAAATIAAAIVTLPQTRTKFKTYTHNPTRKPPVLRQNRNNLLPISSFNSNSSTRDSIVSTDSNAITPTSLPLPSPFTIREENSELKSLFIQELIDRRRKGVVSGLVWVVCGFVGCYLACGNSLAAVISPSSGSIRASGFGLKVAAALRKSGWADEAVVFALAALPVLELRGAIPVGYWMQLNPVQLTVLSVLGNMVPVPFIVLYLKQFATYIFQKSKSATQFLDLLFKRAKEKAGPIEEFQWLGLMLFVAVPFPGTGAWTGAIVASILGMPFWSAVSANFVGVVLAGLLVNLLVNLGFKYAILVGLALFFVSTVMWSVLRHLKMAIDPK